MRTSRRVFLAALASCGAAPTPPIPDREAVVRRNNPRLGAIDPRAPLSLGNGEFAFTADVTGMQSLPDQYEKSIPLCTQSQWGWHTSPIPGGLSPAQLRLEMFDTYGRPVGYPTSSRGQEPLFNWLRENPHRLNLARIGLAGVYAAEVRGVGQELDLWTGTLRSRFLWRGAPVTVLTCCHPVIDAVAFSIRSRAPLSVAIQFPYGSPAMNASDWAAADGHSTTVLRQQARSLDLERRLDADRYFVRLNWRGPARAAIQPAHRVLLSPAGSLELVCHFAPQPIPGTTLDTPDVFRAAERHWKRFWTTGGAVDFSGSEDRRAPELERRVVLSQYQTAIQCSGSSPPQETGLTCNSWYGKFHLEMHWWHAAHFPLWGRTPLLERSMAWYQRILPAARAKARWQGYPGARWPKMVDLSGADSPSPIGPLLIWQQPHPIVLAELCYQAHPGRATLDRYRDLVLASAEFMAGYAVRRGEFYALGPPVIPAQENHPPRETWNPTFELEYWRHGLGLAQKWRERLDLPREPRWDEVRGNLAPLPVKDGVYLAHENCPQTFTERNRDHPSMLAALGVLPGESVDREIMRRTLKRVLAEWRWPDTWGWDFPMVAMTAARLGEPELAVDALFIDSPKNTWLPNGHNWQRPNLPVYLPGNGGLLAAVAMMSAAWNGFPKSKWRVRWEGLRALL
jgi:hypothetical protein